MVDCLCARLPAVELVRGDQFSATSPSRPDISGRRWWRADRLDDRSATGACLEGIPASRRGGANPVSSLCADGRHAQALVLDHRTGLGWSTTLGNSHLDSNEPSPDRYRALLLGM